MQDEQGNSLLVGLRRGGVTGDDHSLLGHVSRNEKGTPITSSAEPRWPSSWVKGVGCLKEMVT